MSVVDFVIGYSEALFREELEESLEQFVDVMSKNPMAQIDIYIDGIQNEEISKNSQARKYVICFAYVVSSLGISFENFTPNTKVLIQECFDLDFNVSIPLGENYTFVDAVEIAQMKTGIGLN